MEPPLTLAALRQDGATTTIERAGQYLGISKAAAYRWAKRGDIPTVRLGRTIRVPVEPLIRLVDPTVLPASTPARKRKAKATA